MLQSILEPREWQMTLGERAALEGIVSALRPQLAIEIGTAEGGSLARIAANSGEVHSFDLAHSAERLWPDNARLHSGDSHELLPAFLAELTDARRSVDFVLVDGDHTADGVRQDIEDLLASPAVDRTVIVIHDALNGEVRRGINAAGLSRPEVVHHDLDFIPGHLSGSGEYEGHLWGGLGIAFVDRSGDAFAGLDSVAVDFEDVHAVFAAFVATRWPPPRRLSLPRLGGRLG